MIIVQNIVDLKNKIHTFQKENQSLGFVPTMGALHEGHLSLLKTSKAQTQKTILSIFVNPTQFGPNEDYSKYPRTFEKDCALAKEAGVDLLFFPNKEDIYQNGFSTFVTENELSKKMCGAFRPGHFQGVCTIVLKLLNLTEAHVIFLGNKDAQQLRLIEHMVQDLNLCVRVQGCETLREPSGLALSSRNQYLSPTEKEMAASISKGLFEALKAFEHGEKNTSHLIEIVKNVLKSQKEIKIQYIELLRWRDFQVEHTLTEKSVLGFAGYLGSTRLIDNVFLEP